MTDQPHNEENRNLEELALKLPAGVLREIRRRANARGQTLEEYLTDYLKILAEEQERNDSGT